MKTNKKTKSKEKEYWVDELLEHPTNSRSLSGTPLRRLGENKKERHLRATLNVCAERLI